MLLVVALVGCQPAPNGSPKPKPPIVPTSFRPNETGTVRGRVVWSGEPPKIADIRRPFDTPGLLRDYPNPNVPVIQATTGGVGGALIFLRGIDPTRARHWDHQNVAVVVDAARIRVDQGDRPVRVGIVRRGDAIAVRSTESRGHILQARGAGVFSLPLLDSDKTTRYPLERSGILTLSSGAGFYWTQGHLWVGEHPYAAVTADDGSFELPMVPEGKWELVSWMPNWNILRVERQPEFGEIERIVFAPAVERSTTVAVVPGASAAHTFSLSSVDFATDR